MNELFLLLKCGSENLFNPFQFTTFSGLLLLSYTIQQIFINGLYVDLAILYIYIYKIKKEFIRTQ